MRIARAFGFFVLLTSGSKAQQPQRLPESYSLQGTVRDARTGSPVPDVSIWPIEKGWGAVTDSAGHYALRWRELANWTFIVRHCDQQNRTTFFIEFFHDSVIHHDLSITGPDTVACSRESRLPWAVDARDTTHFKGHYHYSWEGGGWLQACDGASYHPDWDSKLGEQLNRWRGHGGNVAFVRFQGRVAPDNTEVPPGTFRVGFLGPLYLVNKVDEVRDARPDDCR
jgi:hypothetical protein